MAQQHDFVPAWLNFSTPQLAKSSAPLGRPGEHLDCGASRPGVSRRRHNSSDGFFNNDPRRASAGDWWNQASLSRHDSVDSGVVEGELGGGLGARETVTWAQERPRRRCQVKRLTGERDREQVGAQRQQNGTANARKGGALPSEGGHKDKLKFAEEDFPSLNPEISCGKLDVKPCAVGTPVGVWEHPPSTKRTMTKMLVIKKLSKNAGTAFAASFANPGPHIINGIKTPGSGLSVYKNLVPKPVTTPPKSGPWKPNGRENKPSFNYSDQESAFTIPVASVTKPLINPVTPPTQVSLYNPTPVSPKEPPSSITPHVDITPPRLRLQYPSAEQRSNRGLKDKKNRDVSISTSPSTTPEICPPLSDTDHLSSSLEAEHRLLKAMGWQEYPENDDNFLPLTDDELRDFQAKTKQLKRNRLCQNAVLQKTTRSLLSWRSSIEPEFEEVSETESTSSSQTSDDEPDT